MELTRATAQGDRKEIAGEAPDLVYRLLVLLKRLGKDFSDVVQQLEDRHRE